MWESEPGVHCQCYDNNVQNAVSHSSVSCETPLHYRCKVKDVFDIDLKGVDLGGANKGSVYSVQQQTAPQPAPQPTPHNIYDKHLNLSVSQKITKHACVKQYNEAKRYDDYISGTNIDTIVQDCNDTCKANKHSFFGFECPAKFNSKPGVHCQCYDDNVTNSLMNKNMDPSGRSCETPNHERCKKTVFGETFDFKGVDFGGAVIGSVYSVK